MDVIVLVTYLFDLDKKHGRVLLQQSLHGFEILRMPEASIHKIFFVDFENDVMRIFYRQGPSGSTIAFFSMLTPVD